MIRAAVVVLTTLLFYAVRSTLLFYAVLATLLFCVVLAPSLLCDMSRIVYLHSGESGAGKSETTKHVVNHVIELCKAGKKSLEQRIQQLNPLLEAFGNAKTGDARC